ncbi:MAG TPA: insulinase family protein, partial [Syntrophales bacterium]|nr:insulinase family protein [Syntrophales bacterium]
MTEVTYGFELLQERYIGELKTQARLYKHIQTGAELLSMINDDENKVFGITFRTPPQDSTGVAHILEHSVLCGSRKYPVKEPFVEILKGSLQTFLNAFTYPDRTCYPVASQNVQDFYNLIDVYLDAVFYPRITPEIFQQEGWHYEMEALDGPLEYRGVVFNEMKGANSSPDRLLAEYSQQSLFPDTTYGLDSGGDPVVIPELSYEQFSHFHEQYYHPSNARIFFSGDDDPEERLRLVNEYLKDFQKKMDINSAITIQSRFESPRRVERSFAAGDDSSKGMVAVNWVLSETKDAVTNMALHILGYILLGTPGSPLRKALIESGLGEDITGGGLESELRQLFFSVGLKGVEAGKEDRVEELILETLGRLAADGVEPDAVEAAVNTIEFGLRENNTGSYPRGLVLMLRAMTTWLYDGDPLALLSFESLMSVVKSRIASGETMFEGMIQKYFLDNPHRTTVVMKPDMNLKDQMDAEEKEKLDNVIKSARAQELQGILNNTDRLKKIQETPDSPEALATVPILKLADLEKKNRTIPIAVLNEKGTTVLYHDISTNGIVYVDIGLHLRSLPRRYIPYVPLFSRALLEMGTSTEDYVALSRRIDRKTGGLHPTLFVSSVKEEREAEARLFLCGKAMVPQTGDVFAIIRDILNDVRLDNRERFRQMVLEEKARQEELLVPGGHQAVNLRLRAHFSEAGRLSEQLNGVSYLFFLRELADRVDKDWPSVHAMLEEIRRVLVNRETLLCNVTVDEAGWEQVHPHLVDFAGDIPVGPTDMETEVSDDTLADMHIPEYEGLIIPSQINYVGK